MTVKDPFFIMCLKKINPTNKNIINPFNYNDFFFKEPIKYTSNYSYCDEFFASSFFYKKKFEVIKDFINNIFISVNIKRRLFQDFNKAQHLYHILKKFFNHIITRRYKIYDVSTDLKLNPLVGYDKRYIITIAENKVLYKFSIYDLLYVIQTNLTYTYALFVDPKFPRNPYTNLPFSIHNLYNIFYFAKKLDITLPILFHVFFKSNFDINKLVLNYESIIRDEIIKNFYKNSNITKKYNDIIDILNKYKRYNKNIIIHRKFPKEKVIEELQDILTIELYICYSYNPSKRLFNKNLMIKRLKEFSKKNPLFGRIIVNPPRESSIFNRTITPPNQRLRNSQYDYFEHVMGIIDSPRENIENYIINSNTIIDRLNRYNSRYNYSLFPQITDTQENNTNLRNSQNNIYNPNNYDNDTDNHSDNDTDDNSENDNEEETLNENDDQQDNDTISSNIPIINQNDYQLDN
tara:strand:+ start:572 stop:1957 length:1386 start_codon:yes stop_codon:yes gene_type:complete